MFIQNKRPQITCAAILPGLKRSKDRGGVTGGKQSRIKVDIFGLFDHFGLFAERAKMTKETRPKHDSHASSPALHHKNDAKAYTTEALAQVDVKIVL